MNDFGFILLIIMLFLGPAQLLVNLIALIATKSIRHKKYLGSYFAGVLIYFIACFIGTGTTLGTTAPILSSVLFFGGAFGLALYGGIVFFVGNRLP